MCVLCDSTGIYEGSAVAADNGPTTLTELVLVSYLRPVTNDLDLDKNLRAFMFTKQSLQFTLDLIAAGQTETAK